MHLSAHSLLWFMFACSLRFFLFPAPAERETCLPSKVRIDDAQHLGVEVFSSHLVLIVQSLANSAFSKRQHLLHNTMQSAADTVVWNESCHPHGTVATNG